MFVLYVKTEIIAGNGASYNNGPIGACHDGVDGHMVHFMLSCKHHVFQEISVFTFCSEIGRTISDLTDLLRAVGGSSLLGKQRSDVPRLCSPSTHICPLD